jgi:hypothetical protein
VPRARARDLARRTIGAVIVTALLGAAVAVGAGFTVPGSTASTIAGPPATAPVRTISPAAVPTDGPPPAEPGIRIVARPDSDGSFLVREVITLPAAATEVVLRPPSVRDVGTGFDRLRPSAASVEVDAGGQAVAVPDGPIATEVTVRWAAPTSTLRLQYRLTEVSVLSTPAKAGRSLAAFGSLVAGMPADLPVGVVVTGETVLSLTCWQLPLAERSCGAGVAPTISTLDPIPFDRSQVLVQYDRPAGR